MTKSSIMSLYDRTITETDMSSRWLTWLLLGVMKLAFSASGDGWGDQPGDISVPSIKSPCIHIYLTVFKGGGRGDHPGDTYVSVIISVLYSHLLYTVF